MQKRGFWILSLCMLYSLIWIASGFCSESMISKNFLYPEYSKTISMDFKNADLNDVLKIFSQQSGLNFIASQNVTDKKITLFLDKVPVEEALERILSANGLTYEVQSGSNIFVVKSVPLPVRDLETRVYQLKFATVLSSKLNKTLTITEEETGATEDSGGGGGEAITSDANVPSDIGIFAALQTVLTEYGSITEDPRTNSIIITDVSRQFPIIEQTLSRLDVPVPQILIEVEMLDISKQLGEKLGVKIGDTPLDFYGGKRAHVYPWNQNDVLRKGFVFEDEFFSGLIDASGLKATLQFLKTQTDTKSLARPRILTLNNETAQIKIATNEAIGINTVTGSADALSTQSVEAERVQTGVFLTVTPQANTLTRDIILAISPRVVEAKTGGTFEGKTFKDPEERGAKTIMRVRDGDTVILGGLLKNDFSDTQTKVPILGDIPILGAAFRHKNGTNQDRELVIFLTPHLLDEFTPSKLAKGTRDTIIREQDIPSPRQREVEKALMFIERHR